MDQIASMTIYSNNQQFHNTLQQTASSKQISLSSNGNSNSRQNDHRFTSLHDLDVRKQMLMPLEGYESESLVSLEESIKYLVNLFNNDIHQYVYIAKQNPRQLKDELTHDESAAIHFYSLQWISIHHNLYIHLNQSLRSVDRQALILCFSYLKLFKTALFKLPSSLKTISRGVKGDLSAQYNKDEDIIWWGVSSCAISLSLIEQFIGQNGTTTIFSIEAINEKFLL